MPCRTLPSGGRAASAARPVRRSSAARAQAVVPPAQASPDAASGNGPAPAAAAPAAQRAPEAKNGVQPQWTASTRAIHGGERGGRSCYNDALVMPIAATSTYYFRDSAELIRFQEGTHSSFEYGRYGNPTTRAAEEKICALEGAEDALLSASGMNSATTLMLALVPAGGHVITTTDCYRRTRQFIQTFLPRMGITHTVVDPADVGALTAALAATPTSLFFSESPTNPYLRCVDIRAVSAACRSAGALCVIDSTFATPVNTRALALGADLVLHSATKYLGGHNDLLAGCVAGSAQLVAKVRAMHAVLGGVLDPHAAYLLLRGMKTLALRVERHNASALRLAAVLESHPRVARVHYPGLASHQDHAVAVRQMGGGFGGVVSFEVVGDLWDTARFIDACRLPYIAPSLGGVETLIEQPTIISYWDQGAAKRAEIGIRDNLVRLSVGVEDYDDIEADILQALDASARAPAQAAGIAPDE